MAFTYSISNGDAVITQTGTDTSLSGLSGLTGVTVSGVQYTLDNTRLVVDGTLTAPRSTNRLRFANYVDRSANFMAVFKINGTFDNSEARVINGVVVNDPLPSISFDFEKARTKLICILRVLQGQTQRLREWSQLTILQPQGKRIM